MSERCQIEVGAGRRVSALLLRPERARACYVFAHGAGAGMAHASMETIAEELAQRGVATLRYQFPYMESGSKRPDPPPVCHAAVRAAVATAATLTGLPLLAGGRSFGGRMTSQAQALEPLPHVRGLVFFGFPLHPAGKPSIERAAHLTEVRIPMLFLQGTRDELAVLELLKQVIEGLGDSASLRTLQDADHAFRAPAARTRRSEARRSMR